MKFPIGSNHDAIQHVYDWQAGRLTAAAVVWLALIAIALTIAACGSENAAGDETPFLADTPTSIQFPQRTSDRDDMDALLIGTLVIEGDCLYVESSVPPKDDSKYLVIWPQNAELRVTNGAIEILDNSNQAVVKVGDVVRLGGGEVRKGTTPDVVPDDCGGPYWIAAHGLTRVDPVEATQEARSATPYGIYLHRQEPEDRSGIDPGVLTGQLIVVDDCLRVTTDDGKSYLIVWPPGYTLDAAPMVRVLNAEGQVVARIGVGIETRLAGGAKETLGRDLPGRCPGPYWIVEEEAGTPVATEETT